MPAEWILTVGQLNEYVRRQLAGDPMLRALRVRGEISGFLRHSSGHIYFTLKDEAARVKCVLFRQYAQTLDFAPADGMQVVVSGSASLYVRDGGYQIYCESIRREGEGELYLRFAKLKAKLEAEGLFDPALKQSPPLLPRCVGVVTSASGAAFHDILRVIGRRYPGMDVVLSPTAVQGEGAAREIAQAIRRLDQAKLVDVLLVGRGGGSMEDLFAFNEEIVARAIAECKTPVISCVGHEIDFTIADFVADVRAATPSMAAELAVPVKEELLATLHALAGRRERAIAHRLALSRARLQALAASPYLTMSLEMLVRKRREALAALRERAYRAQTERLRAAQTRLATLAAALEKLHPDAPLARGYALVLREGAPVGGVAALKAGMAVSLRMRDGEARAKIESVEENEHEKDL